MLRKQILGMAGLAATMLIASSVTMTVAHRVDDALSPARGVTPTVLGRGNYDSFKVTSLEGPAMLTAEANAPIDVVVRRHEYVAGGSTGWHANPYPVFITVLTGQVTFYDVDDPTCSPTVVSAGHGYVDSGHGHIGRNETDQPATDISVIMAPVDGALRTDLSAPGPYCGF